MAMPADTWAPPAHDEAEQALLGAVLHDNRLYDRVADFLAPEHFADATHARIFQACGSLINKGREANAVTLKGYFDHEKTLEEVGGARYLATLQAGYVTALNVRDYGKLIHDFWVRRQLIGLGEGLSRDAHSFDMDGDALSLVEEAQDALVRLLETGQREGGLEDAQSLLRRVAEQTAAVQRGEVESGLPTGLIDLDRLTGGLHAGDLTILAGRPGMGKTALALKIAERVAMKGGPVAFFSLEMSAEQLMRRLACDRAGVEYTRTLQRNGLKDDEFRAMVDACAEVRDLPLWTDGTPRLSPAQIHARSLGMKRRRGLGLIIVDHLGHVTPPHRSDKRHQDLGDITKALKATAKRLGAPVLLLCQLNRGVESRDDKRPTLADLRESGQIEEDADVVMFCYREHYYIARNEPRHREGESQEKFADRMHAWEKARYRAAGKGEVIVAKQRSGAVESVGLSFVDRFMRWGDLARTEDMYEGR